MDQRAPNPYLVLSYPLLKLKKDARVYFDDTLKDVIQIEKDNITITSLHKNLKDATFRLQQHDVLYCKS